MPLSVSDPKERHPTEWALARRAASAALSLASALTSKAKREILSEKSDALVLLRLLAEASVIDAARRAEPLIDAKLRAIERRKAMIDESGGLLSTVQAAGLLGVRRQVVNRRIREGRLLAVKTGSRLMLPSFQIRNGEVLNGLPDVLKVLSVDAPWMRLNFFLMRHPSLGGMRPADALADGDLETVVHVASAFGEHTAS